MCWADPGPTYLIAYPSRDFITWRWKNTQQGCGVSRTVIKSIAYITCCKPSLARIALRTDTKTPGLPLRAAWRITAVPSNKSSSSGCSFSSPCEEVRRLMASISLFGSWRSPTFFRRPSGTAIWMVVTKKQRLRSLCKCQNYVNLLCHRFSNNSWT